MIVTAPGKPQKTAKKAGPTAAPKTKAKAAGRPLKGLLTRKLREAQARKFLLLISTGDTCRSPMAAAYLKKLLEERKVRNIEVRSAGVMTIPGLLATDESKLMLEPYGISLDRHRSQPLTEEMIKRADLILGMTPFHVQMALRMSEEARGKTYLLKEYTQTDPRGRPIPDPMGCTLEVYKRCLRQIKQACDRLVEMRFFTGTPSRAERLAASAASAGTSAVRPRCRPASGSNVSSGGPRPSSGAKAVPEGKRRVAAK